MHFQIAQTQLKKLLVTTKRTTGNAAKLPEFGATLLVAAGGQLNARSLDGTLSASLSAPCQTIGVGFAVVVAKDFKSLVDSMSGTVDVRTDDGTLVVIDDTASFTIGLVEVPDTALYREPQTLATPEPIDVDRMAAVAKLASTDQSRPVLTGVNFRPGKIEATDSYKLGQLDVDHPFTGLVPARLFEVARLAKLTDATLSIGEGSAVITGTAPFGTARLSAQLMKGRYPNVDPLIPDNFTRRYVLQTKPTTDALKRLGKLDAGRKVTPVVTEFNGSQVKLSLSSGGQGGELTLDAEGSGAFRAGYNPLYLRAVLDAFDADTVNLDVRDELKPAVVHADEGLRALVMPVRL